MFLLQVLCINTVQSNNTRTIIILNLPLRAGMISLNGEGENVNLLTYEELTNVFGETLPTLFVAIYRTTSCASSHTNGCLWVSNQENAVYLYRNFGTSGFANAVDLSTSTPTITKTQGLIIPRYPSYYFKSGEHYYSVSRYDG